MVEAPRGNVFLIVEEKREEEEKFTKLGRVKRSS